MWGEYVTGKSVEAGILRPNGDDDGVVGVACFMELDGDVAAGNHFGDRDATGHGDVLQPYR